MGDSLSCYSILFVKIMKSQRSLLIILSDVFAMNCDLGKKMY